MRHYSKIALAILAILVIGVLIFAAYYIANRDIRSSGSSKVVTLVIDYNDNWTGTYYFSDAAIPMYGTGHMEFPKSLDQGTNDIRFSIQKGDSSSSELSISILDSDGELLKSVSTSEANGVAPLDIRVD